MIKRSFKVFAALTLFIFLGSPLSAFAMTQAQLQQLTQLQLLQQSGTLTPQQTQQLQALILLQQQGQSQPYYGSQQNPGAGNALNQLGFLSLLGGLNSGGPAGGNNQLLTGLAVGSMLGTGGGGSSSPVGTVGQFLTIAGLASGNMILTFAGMITSMIGGLAGGAGSTPQRGAVDEQYIAPGQAGPYGAGGYNPYYTTPTPVPNAAAPSTPASSCDKTIFIVKDTTVTPNTVRPYPTAVEIPQNQCVLAINSDTSASHSVQIKDQNTVKATESIDKEQSHIFRFENKKAYTLCVDAVSAACTTVTVK